MCSTPNVKWYWQKRTIEDRDWDTMDATARPADMQMTPWREFPRKTDAHRAGKRWMFLDPSLRSLNVAHSLLAMQLQARPDQGMSPSAGLANEIRLLGRRVLPAAPALPR